MLLSAAILVWVYMTAWFIVAVWQRDNGLVDIAWGLGFLALAVWPVLAGMPLGLPYFTLAGMIALWALRLSGYLWLRYRRREAEDFRYRQWRQQWGRNWIWRSYLQVFLLQGLFMWVIALPITLSASHPTTGSPLWHLPGLLVFGAGWLWETIGDAQLSRFKRDPHNKGKIMTTGLWRYSRHPNYFGECVAWWGIFMYTLPFEHSIWAVISPLTLTWLLLRVSGVPMLEEKYRDNPEFQDYARRTNAFVPGVPDAKPYR